MSSKRRITNSTVLIVPLVLISVLDSINGFDGWIPSLSSFHFTEPPFHDAFSVDLGNLGHHWNEMERLFDPFTFSGALNHKHPDKKVPLPKAPSFHSVLPKFYFNSYAKSHVNDHQKHFANSMTDDLDYFEFAHPDFSFGKHFHSVSGFGNDHAKTCFGGSCGHRSVAGAPIDLSKGVGGTIGMHPSSPLHVVNHRPQDESLFGHPFPSYLFLDDDIDLSDVVSSIWPGWNIK